MMTLIDTHAHIYLDNFKSDRDAMMERGTAAGVRQVLLPAVDSSTHTALFELEAAYPGICLPMMGLHPTSVNENYREELKIVEEKLSRRRFQGVGEIGLDFYWDISFKEQQYEAFRLQLQWAKQYGLPVSIHSRNATPECLDVVEELQDGGLKGAFHCFSGTEEEAGRATALGFYLGIGGVLTFRNSGLDRVVEAIDPAWFILETDAPYLAPVPFRGKRNEPSYLTHVVQKLADLKQVNVQEMSAITTANAQKLFGL